VSHADHWRDEANKLFDRLYEEKGKVKALQSALGNAMSWVNLYHDTPAQAMKAEAAKLLAQGVCTPAASGGKS
jgi:hypothetical protein